MIRSTASVRISPVVFVALAPVLFLVWELSPAPGSDQLVGDAFLTVIAAFAAVEGWRAARRCAAEPALRLVWLLFSVAVLSGFVGGLSGLVRDITDAGSDRRGVADAAALAFYPVMLVALLRVPKPPSSRASRLRIGLDVAAIAIGITTLIWYLVVGPAIWDQGRSSVDLVLSYVFPAGDIALIVGIAFVVARGCPPVLRRPLALIEAALVLIIASDVLLSREAVHQFGGDDALVSFLYISAISLGAVAAMTQRTVVAGEPAAQPSSTNERLWKGNWLPPLAVVLGFGALLVSELDQPFFPDASLAIAATVLAVLVGARQYVAQRELTRLQDRFRGAVDDMAEGMIQFTVAGRIIWANRAAETYFGAERGGLVDHDVAGMIVGAAWDDLFGVRATVTGRRLDGRVFPIELAVSDMYVDGERVLVAVGQDVSERTRREVALRRSEQRFRGVFDSAGIGIVLAETVTGKIVDINAAAGAMLGGPPEVLRGLTYATFLPRGEAGYRGDREVMAVVAGLAAPGEAVQREVRIGRLDGGSLWVHLTLSNAEDELGGTGSIICVIKDITARRAVERVKDEFVSVVGHELRTPLTSIRGSLGLIQSGMLEEDEEEEMMVMAVSNADRLSRLIEDILDVERLDAGRTDLGFSPAPVRDLVASSLEVVQRMADDARVTVRVEADDLTVHADGDRIVQTLVNLLSNAVKFSPAGAEVVVRVERGEDEALFSVVDAGRGIPADHLESIFERFRQVDGSDAREKGGTGLGLAIARGIVLQHSGRIWAESPAGGGAAFRFTLPLKALGSPARES